MSPFFFSISLSLSSFAYVRRFYNYRFYLYADYIWDAEELSIENVGFGGIRASDGIRTYYNISRGVSIILH